MGRHDTCVANISVWLTLRIHLFSYVIGAWVCMKRFAKWTWDPNGLFAVHRRDNPPACLVDSTIGRHSYVKLKGVKLHYVEAGAKTQPLLLLLHGFPDCWLSWRHQIQPLSQHFRVIALDMKGFGDSDKPLRRKKYRIDIILDELKQFISAQGVSTCSIVGHDLGAHIGWYFVHEYPELVNKFVSVSCTHPNLYWDNLCSQNIFNSSWLSFIQLPYLPEIDTLREDIRVITDSHKHLQAKDVKDSKSVVEAYKYSFSRKDDWTGPLNYYRNLPFCRVYEDTSQITVSTLLITGNKDDFIRLEGIVKSTDYCEKFVMKIVEGAGHFPHQENPETFNRLLLNFLCIGQSPPKSPEKYLSKGIMDRMFGAVTTTVKYGNSVLDSVQKRTNGVVSIPTRAVNMNSS